MSKVIVFDTETNGFKGKPLLVQLGYIVYDMSTEEEIFKRDTLIKVPEETVWNDGSFKVHGITKEKCLEEGAPLMQEMLLFQGVINQCEYIIAHNLDFDRKVINAQFDKLKLSLRRPLKSKMLCTMKTTSGLTPSGKWPKLDELHRILFDEGFDGAHDAFIDVKATLRCFIELLKRNHYEDVI